jgi:hypothetical protein
MKKNDILKSLFYFDESEESTGKKSDSKEFSGIYNNY